VWGKNDVPGLEYHSTTVGRLFKSGFGRFGLGQASSDLVNSKRMYLMNHDTYSELYFWILQTKPSLADQNILMVFVVGGINAAEVWIL
jgi:hypothetical protein